MCVVPVITHFPTREMALVMKAVKEERLSQDGKWGEQNHPNGTGDLTYKEMAELAKEITDEAAARGILTWAMILDEEVLEALAEDDPTKLREELVQVAAVAVQWVEAIDRGTQANES